MRTWRRKREIVFAEDVRLRSSVKNDRLEDISAAENIGAILIKSIFMILSAIGIMLMYQDVFLSNQKTAVYCIVAANLTIVLVVLYQLEQQKKLVIIGTICVLVFAMISLWKPALEGLVLIWNSMLNLINSYYSIHLASIKMEGLEKAEPTQAFLILTAWLVFGMTTICIGKKKIWGVVVPGVVLLIAELLVGYVPGWVGVMLFFTGFFGLLPICNDKTEDGKRDSIFSCKIGVGLGTTAIIVALMLHGIGAGSVEKVSDMQQNVLAYQRYYERMVMNSKAFSFLGGESGKVSNNRPLYTERDVLKLELDGYPKKPIYLRGYVGDTYQDGNWVNESEKEFGKASDDWQLSSKKDPGFLIQNMIYDSQLEKTSTRKMNYTISYLATGNKYAYLPYFTDLDTVTQEIYVDADGILERTSIEDQSLTGFENSNVMDLMDNARESARRDTLNQEYQDYLSLYLQVPEGLDKMDELGLKLKQTLGMLEQKGASREDIELAAICMVRKAVNDRVSYSLNLEPLPADGDVVENFLFDSGKGFCTHYASAGTILFRELGIPARYVTGYVVQNDNVKVNDQKKFTAMIKDSAEHAWVEIYLDGIGWYPVEMISGFDDELDSMMLFRNSEDNYAIRYEQDQITVLRRLTGSYLGETVETWTDAVEDDVEEDSTKTDTKTDKQPASTNNQTATTINDQTTSTEQGTSQDNSDEDTKQQDAKEENVVSDDSSGTVGTSGKTDTQTDHKRMERIGTNILRGLGGVLVILVIVLSIIGLIKRRERKIAQSFQQKNYKRAICSISRQIYLLLRRKGKIHGSKLDDVQYFQEMEKLDESITKEEVQRLKMLVEMAAFSQETLTKEDVIYCIKIYQKIKQLH